MHLRTAALRFDFDLILVAFLMQVARFLATLFAAAFFWAAIFLPLHVVISGHDRQTEIQVQNKVQAGHEAAAPALFGPVMETQAQISEAIDSIAMRPSILV